MLDYGYNLMTDKQREQVYRLLRSIGVPGASKSLPAIAATVAAYRKNPGAICGQWTAQILPVAASDLDISTDALERLIARAIDAAWRVDKGRTAKNLLGLHEKPRARAFIIAVSEAIV